MQTVVRRSPATILVAVACAAMLVVGFDTPASATPPARGAEASFVAKINVERRQAGLEPLRESAQMSRIARGWAASMAGGRGLAHNPGRKGQVNGPWQRLGENVGYSRLAGASEEALVDRVHAALMNSEGHRKNILGAYNQVGVGVVIAADGTMWVTQNFLDGPVGAFPLFADTSGSTHEPNIEAIWREQITQGCKGGVAYCPSDAVTRAEMASFLSRALGLTVKAGNSGFADVSGTHAGSVGALAASGITGGCETGRFCPSQPVTRAQLATFLVRALPDLEPVSGSRFTDVPASLSHAANVNAVAAAGITTGCGQDRFCPSHPVTRAQMATFLARALSL